MRQPSVVVREADELLRIAERLTGGDPGDATPVVAALLVLGADADQEDGDSLWGAYSPRSRLDQVIEPPSPHSPQGSSDLRAQWRDWSRVADRGGLFPDEELFEGFSPARVHEAARDVHALLRRLPPRKGRYLIGETFDRFLSLVSERQGKRGSDFSTPRSVNELMVRLADLRLGMVVGDFYAGQGGTLIAALNHVGVPELGETPVSGAEVNQASVFLARVNLFLHDTDPRLIRHEDTLSRWRPTDDQGRGFDRILSNPPFALRYDEEEYRLPPDFLGHTSGTKSELMMLQQMRASIRPGGRVIMAMPHGPLFRGGPEERIRRALLERGEIEAVIGIGPNLFLATAIPACLIVLRSPVESPSETTDVLLINAEREVEAGRNRNRLEPRHIEKIVRVFERRAQVPGFSRVVSQEEIAAHSYDLNIRRYIEAPGDRAPAPDLGAMISGGVPPREVDPVRERFAAFGARPERFFEQGPDGRLFAPEPGGFAAVLEGLLALGEPVAARLRQACRSSWPQIVQRAYPSTSRPTLGDFRQRLVDGLCAELTRVGALDEYELAGAFAQVWADHAHELRERFRDEGRESVAHLSTRLVDPLNEQIEELVRRRGRALAETVQGWNERYGVPLTRLLEHSARADRRFEARLADMGLDLEGRS